MFSPFSTNPYHLKKRVQFCNQNKISHSNLPIKQMPLISPHTETSKELGHLPKFVKILYQLLQQEDHSEYLTWSQDGRGVIIQNPTEFAERLLPTYFKHCNYSSFVRQVNPKFLAYLIIGDFILAQFVQFQKEKEWRL